MTWVRFTRDWDYMCVTYTEKFKAGQHLNRPRHVVEAAVKAGAGVKEVKTLAQQRKDKA